MNLCTMKTKIVYCLVSNSKDYYYEQLLISLCSLRKHNPDVTVEVVCDRDTYDTLKDNRSGIYDCNIKVNTVETPKEWGNWERSRYIKTNLRNLTKGDYLFVDTDTVICSSLECIDDIKYDVAAVRDSHVERPLPKITQCQHDTEFWIWGQAQKAKVDIEGLWHNNSGVMYVKDTPKAYELYSKWADNYTKMLAHGAKVDQLPLLLSNHEMEDIIAPLDPRLNCQVAFDEGRTMVQEAKIIHYFPGQKKTLLASPWILDPIKETGKIPVTIQRIIDNPQTFFDKMSMVVEGDSASLIETRYLLEASRTCPKAFNIFVYMLNRYLSIKKKFLKKMS